MYVTDIAEDLQTWRSLVSATHDASLLLWLQTCAITMNMMAGPPLFKRAIVQMGEARATLHPALSQDLEGAMVTDRRCKLACIGVCVTLHMLY